MDDMDMEEEQEQEEETGQDVNPIILARQ